MYIGFAPEWGMTIAKANAKVSFSRLDLTIRR
jgi:hypothetical protein